MQRLDRATRNLAGLCRSDERTSRAGLAQQRIGATELTAAVTLSGEVSGGNFAAVGFRGRHKTLPQFLNGDEAGADLFALAPDQRAHPKHLATGGEGETEKIRHRQRAHLPANSVLADIDDHAFDPRRIGRRNQESRLVQIDPDRFARSGISSTSRHRPPSIDQPRRKYLNSCYLKTLTIL